MVSVIIIIIFNCLNFSRLGLRLWVVPTVERICSAPLFLISNEEVKFDHEIRDYFHAVFSCQLPESAGGVRSIYPQRPGRNDGNIYVGTTRNNILEGSLQRRFNQVRHCRLQNCDLEKMTKCGVRCVENQPFIYLLTFFPSLMVIENWMKSLHTSKSLKEGLSLLQNFRQEVLWSKT